MTPEHKRERNRSVIITHAALLLAVAAAFLFGGRLWGTVALVIYIIPPILGLLGLVKPGKFICKDGTVYYPSER